MAAEHHGVPVGWAIDGANRNDVCLLGHTLQAVTDAGLLCDIETLHLDRCYDYPAVHRQLADTCIADACIQRGADTTGPPNAARPALDPSSPPTPGCRTTGNSAATPTEEPTADTPPCASPPPS